MGLITTPALHAASISRKMRALNLLVADSLSWYQGGGREITGSRGDSVVRKEMGCRGLLYSVGKVFGSGDTQSVYLYTDKESSTKDEPILQAFSDLAITTIYIYTLLDIPRDE